MSGVNKDKGTLAAVLLMERIVRDIYPSKHSSAIQPLQWSILRYLQRMPVERREQRWIARFLGITSAPVTRALQTLQDRGFVSIKPSDADSRVNAISLTDAGVEILASDPILKIAKSIRSWPLDQQQHFASSMRSLALDSELLKNEEK